MIEVKKLIKDYGTFRAVNGISFSMKKGEILGFLGPNGAGKSTTMKVLTGFIAADGGSATIDGFDVTTHSIEARRRLGYLPENTPLYEDMGVVEFLEWISWIRKIPKLEKWARIDEAMEMCGLFPMAGKTIGQLSRGYRQRVGLAQALIHDPDILILDEPTSALDPSQVVEIREMIKRIGKTKSILLSTHIMQEVSAACNRVIIISKGKIVAQGTPESLVTSESGERRVTLEVEVEAGELKSALGRLDSLSKIDVLSSDNGDTFSTAKLVFSKSKQDPRLQLHEMIKEKNWKLRELHEEKDTLENVFIRVTSQG